MLNGKRLWIVGGKRWEVMDSWREKVGSHSNLVEVRKLIEKECEARVWK